MATRREFLVRCAALTPVMFADRAVAQDSGAVGVPPQGTPDTLGAERLRDPTLVGRARDSATAFDNDPTVIGIERRLKCTCGCTLDIYTCRTTDFTCTYSPALHREVVEMVKAGQTPEQIVAAFVAREGEKMLMSPTTDGFNLAGYLVPGLAVGSGALVLAAYLSRRRQVATAEQVVVAAGTPEPLPQPDEAQLERLRRALDEVES